MIRESFFFSFDGVKSTDFNIINVNVSEGIYNEPLTSGKTINEIFVRGRVAPYFIDVEKEPKVLELKFFFEHGYDDKLIHKIVRWLDVDSYRPLFFSEDIDRVFYAMPVEGINKIHNGLKEGYLTINMRCDSSYSYSHDILTSEIDTSRLEVDEVYNTPIIKIGNKGHHSMYPKIWIEKISDGDIVIKNKSNNNQEFKFEDIEVGEKLFIDCENEVINTSKEKTYRYDNFNDNFLKIVFGENILSVTNNMKIKFSYRYIFS